MSGTLKNRRLQNALEARRCAHQCARCLALVAGDAWGADMPECKFPTSAMLTMGFKQDDKQYNKCHYCLTTGENCVKLPDEYNELLSALDALMQAFLDASETDKLRARATMVDEAKSLLAVFQGSHPKYSQSCFLHDGLSTGDQSGVTFKGRDRSKAGVLKQNRRQQAALEAPLDDEFPSDFGTPKRIRYTAAGTAETPRERRAREEAEAAEQEAERRRRRKNPSRRGGRGAGGSGRATAGAA